MLGFTVLLTARDPNKRHIAARQLADKEGLNVIYYLLDVTNRGHIEAVA
jgi:short-subunit dehydrogenase